MSLPTEYTTPVIPQEFSGAAQELPSYAAYLLGLVAGMNEDRAATGAIIKAYESKQ